MYSHSSNKLLITFQDPVEQVHEEETIEHTETITPQKKKKKKKIKVNGESVFELDMLDEKVSIGGLKSQCLMISTLLPPLHTHTPWWGLFEGFPKPSSM